MIYNWYLIFNLVEFEALNLVSKTYTQLFEDIGQRDVLVTKGDHVSIFYDDVFLPINLNDKNPFEFEDYAVYIDESDNVYLGILVPDEN